MELKRGEKERMTGRERSEESLRGRWREEEESYGLANASKLVDQMASGGRLSRIDMANDNNVDVNLLLTHT